MEEPAPKKPRRFALHRSRGSGGSNKYSLLCSLCGQSFQCSVASFRRHLTRRHLDRDGEGEIEAAMRRAEESVGLGSCGVCGNAAFLGTNGALSDHVNKAHEMPLAQYVERFAEELQTWTEAERRIKAAMRNLSCTLCPEGVRVRGIIAFHRHFEEVHKEGRKAHLYNVIPAISQQLGLLDCSECRLSFLDEEGLARHMRFAHGEGDGGEFWNEPRTGGEAVDLGQEELLYQEEGEEEGLDDAGYLDPYYETSEVVEEKLPLVKREVAKESPQQQRHPSAAPSPPRGRQKVRRVVEGIVVRESPPPPTRRDPDLDGCLYQCPACLAAGNDSESPVYFYSLSAVSTHVVRQHGGGLALLASLEHSRAEERRTKCRVCGAEVVADRVELGHHLWAEHGLPLEAYRYYEDNKEEDSSISKDQ